MSRLVFLDTETTSLDDERGEVWEIAAIVRQPGQADAEHLWEIRPDLSTADPISLRVGRYYERRVLGSHSHVPGAAAELASPMLVELGRQGGDLEPQITPTASAVAAKLAEWLDSAHVVGAVPDFDFRFLRRFLRANGQCWTAHYHLVDIEAMAVGWLYGKASELRKAKPDVDWSWTLDELTELPWKSTSLYRAAGIDPDDFEAHTALGDARLVRAVYDAITGSGATQ